MDIDSDSPIDFFEREEKEEPVTADELAALEKRISEVETPEPEKLAERVSRPSQKYPPQTPNDCFLHRGFKSPTA